MTTFPAFPRPLKDGIVLIDSDTSIVREIMVLQSNPDTLTRTLQSKRLLPPPRARILLEHASSVPPLLLI